MMRDERNRGHLALWISIWAIAKRRVVWYIFGTVIYESDSVERTERIAAELASRLRGGECLALEGDLGAGKTQFVRGLVLGLGGGGAYGQQPDLRAAECV